MPSKRENLERLLQSAYDLQQQQRLQAIPIPSVDSVPKDSKPMNTDKVKDIVIGLLGMVLGFVGASDTYPLYVNLFVYALALIGILYAVWRWKASKAHGVVHRAVILAVAFMVYSALIWYPVSKQYSRETNINVTFKESPAFTWWRRQLIQHDLAKFRDFLKALDIQVPDSIPPFGVATGRLAEGTYIATPPNLSLNRSELSIGESVVKDRLTVTGVYAGYVVARDLKNANADIPQPITPNQNRIYEWGSTLMVGVGFSRYFNYSFWGKAPPDIGFPPLHLFWDLRKPIGAHFADRLAVATMKAINDNPAEVRDGNLNLYIVRALKIGEYTIESDCSSWPKIERYLEGYIPADSMKAQDLSHSYVSEGCLQVWKQ
jgi:hypothetical protein